MPPALPRAPDGGSGWGHGHGAGDGRSVPLAEQRAEAVWGPASVDGTGWGPCCRLRKGYGTPVSEGASSGTFETISTWSMRSPRKARQAAVSASVS